MDILNIVSQAPSAKSALLYVICHLIRLFKVKNDSIKVTVEPKEPLLHWDKSQKIQVTAAGNTHSCGWRKTGIEHNTNLKKEKQNRSSYKNRHQ